MRDSDALDTASGEGRLSCLGRVQAALDFGTCRRLGIMGGTFDPIHFGHLLCAERAREAFDLDMVLFMPAGVPSFKRDKVIASPSQRVEMVRLSVSDNAYFDLSDMEALREGTTYTVDSLMFLSDRLGGGVELFFITGSDALKTIGHWHKAELMRSLATFIGVSRPGYSSDASDLRKSGFSVELLRIDALHISSSDIRDRLRRGLTARYLTPAGVLRYIEAEGLYRQGLSGAQGAELPGTGVLEDICGLAGGGNDL